MQTWKEVAGFPDYEVSDEGNVRSFKTYHRKVWPIILKQSFSYGYTVVNLSRDGKQSVKKVHSLVAAAFLSPMPIPGMDVNHKDSNRGNPRLENLEWMTRKENLRHGVEAGNHNHGDRNGNAKLTNQQVQELLLLRVSGSSCKDLAARFNVTAKSVRRIVSGARYKHSPRPSRAEIPYSKYTPKAFR